MGATEDTTMARGLLMPSPATDTTAMGELVWSELTAQS